MGYAQDVLDKAVELLAQYNVARYMTRLAVYVDGEVAMCDLIGLNDVPPTRALLDDFKVKINGDLRSWTSTEQEYRRPCSLYGYVHSCTFEPIRPEFSDIYWYPYTAENAGVRKANHALVVTTAEICVHEAFEIVALQDFPRWNIREYQEELERQFWSAVSEHPAWPHCGERYAEDGDGVPTAKAWFPFHPEPVRLDIAF